MAQSLSFTTTRGSATITAEQARRQMVAIDSLRRNGAEISTSFGSMSDEELAAASDQFPPGDRIVAGVEHLIRQGDEGARAVDQRTGEIHDHQPRQEALPVLRDLGVTHPYRVQLTTVTEAEVDAGDEEAAADRGLDKIDQGDGEIIKRQVTVTLVRH